MIRHKLPVAVHIFLFRQEQILLLRRFHTGYADGCYSVPAGHLNGQEPVRMAAIREAREEVGITIEPENLSFAGVFHRSEEDERIDFFVKATRWVGEPFNAEPGKCDELRWVKTSSLPGNTIPYIRRAIENLAPGIPFQEYGWDKEK